MEFIIYLSIRIPEKKYEYHKWVEKKNVHVVLENNNW